MSFFLRVPLFSSAFSGVCYTVQLVKKQHSSIISSRNNATNSTVFVIYRQLYNEYHTYFHTLCLLHAISIIWRDAKHAQYSLYFYGTTADVINPATDVVTDLSVPQTGCLWHWSSKLVNTETKFVFWTAATSSNNEWLTRSYVARTS